MGHILHTGTCQPTRSDPEGYDRPAMQAAALVIYEAIIERSIAPKIMPWL